MNRVKTAADNGNRSVSKYLIAKKSSVPLELHHRLGHKKGVIRAVGKFPGYTGGIFISTENDEYLELKVDPRHCSIKIYYLLCTIGKCAMSRELVESPESDCSLRIM